MQPVQSGDGGGGPGGTERRTTTCPGTRVAPDNLFSRLNPRCETGDVPYMQQGGRSFSGELTAADLRGRSKLWNNRRREPRIPCERELAILSSNAAEGEGFRRVGLIGCSAHGLGIISPVPMKVGDQFLAKLRLDRVMLAAYTIRHCTLAADGKHYKIGAELTAFIGTPGGNAQAALDALLGRGEDEDPPPGVKR